ncbi:MAG: amidohydrolase family protein [Bryobacteraceae bacterium]
MDPSSGQGVEVRFGELIAGVEPILSPDKAEGYVSPGWIDVQVNGFAGVDYCSPEAPVEEIARSIHAQFATGVTRLFPTVITGSRENMAGAIRNLAKAKAELDIEGRAMAGFHIEGPHISPEDGPRGAHPVSCVRAPETGEFDRWMELSDGAVKMVTVSPEWPGIAAYIEHAVTAGVVIAIGHTKATAEQIDEAVRAGATISTHLGNGAHSVMRRHPNYIWDQLADDRLAASFIVDGIHLPASFVKSAIRAKGVERSILVTDAVMPAGCEPGRYRLGEVDVELHADDRVTLVGLPRLAGSSLRMHRGVGNLTKLAGLQLFEAIAMAARNPARVCRIPGRQRGLQAGDRADLVQFQFDAAKGEVEVDAVYLDGERVYRRA